MQVSAINPSFQGKRDNIDALIATDDNTIRQVAYLKTASHYNYKKERNISTALYYSAPIAAGIAAAVLSEGKNTKIFSREVSGLAARAAKGLKVGALWTAALGAVDLLGYGKKKLAENSSEVRKFDNEHSFLSMAAMIATGLGAITLANRGYTKLAQQEAPKFLQKATVKTAKFINKNTTIQNMKTTVLKWAEKTPSALKEIGAAALDWSPTMLLLGGLFHSIGTSHKVNNEYAKNYIDLKNRQEQLSKARLRELSIQNDFLMQNPQNREDIALLNNPLAGLE